MVSVERRKEAQHFLLNCAIKRRKDKNEIKNP